jgi:hypothetical protein
VEVDAHTAEKFDRVVRTVLRCGSRETEMVQTEENVRPGFRSMAAQSEVRASAEEEKLGMLDLGG